MDKKGFIRYKKSLYISKNLNLSSKQKYSKKQKLGENFIADIKAIPYPDKPGKRKSKGIIME